MACAATLIFQGFARLTVVGRSEARGMAARKLLRKNYPNADVRFVAADVSTPAGANSVVEACAATFGRIDALISVAGGAPIPRLLHEIPIEDVGRIIGSISSGVLLPVRAVLPIMMEEKGRLDHLYRFSLVSVKLRAERMSAQSSTSGSSTRSAATSRTVSTSAARSLCAAAIHATTNPSAMDTSSANYRRSGHKNDWHLACEEIFGPVL